MSEFLEFLIASVEESAEWRAEKAAQFPDDERNERCSAALAVLARNLRALPARDGHAQAYDAAMGRLVEFEDALIEMGEHETRHIGRYGFDYPEDGDPRAFLSALTRICDELVEDAEMDAAEAERQQAYEDAQHTAGEATKATAAEEARKFAEDAARKAAEEAYKAAYDKAYKSAYDEAYRETLLRALQA